jgi:putative spermidine/putrescine transport system substrate-binding protein|tara:strand:+ start:1890 stop:2999 length:1110 start_codon:yes stop_codon:yes gene_type:complete
MIKNLFITIMASFISLVMASAAFAGGHINWSEVETKAKEEGEVFWFNWYLEEPLQNFAKRFEDEYGIKVTVPAGENQTNLDKVVAEKDRAKGDVDVLSIGFNRVPDLAMDDLFIKLADSLPADENRTPEMAGIDGLGYAYAFWGNQSGIAYDPEFVAEADLPQTPAEFQAFWNNNPGKFGFNFENGGSGPSFFLNVIKNLTDVDFDNGESTDSKIAQVMPSFEYFNNGAENYIITGGNADSIQRISDRELWMAPAWEDHLAGLMNRGEVRKGIAYYIPEMGMYGGGNGIVIPKNAPNPNAALFFANWLLSAETQTAFNTEFGTAPMHKLADDSNALVPNSQRAFRTNWAAQPFRGEVEEMFVENVILER